MEESEEVDFLKFQRKVNTLLGMPFYVNSMNRLGDRFGEMLTSFHQLFTEMIVIIVTIGQFWAVPHIFEDMNVLCGCLSSASHSSQIIAKTVLLRNCKTFYLTQIKTVHTLQREADRFERAHLQRESNFENYYNRKKKYIGVIVVIQLIVNFISTSAYFLPFVYDSIINEEGVRGQLTPIVVYLPMDFNYTPLFQVVVVTLTMGFYVINLKTVVMDNFILSLIVLHKSQLEYHNNLLKEIVERQSKSGEVEKDVIRAWIKQHQDLSRNLSCLGLYLVSANDYSACNDFRKLMSSYLFIEFSYIIIHTCMPAFVITSTFSWTLPQKVAVFFMVGGGLVELFLMSSAGGAFSDSWLSIKTDLLQSEYMFKKEKWMKNMTIMIQQKIQKPYHLSAFNIIPLNRGTFASILRLIFSYYMTLNQVQKVKRYD